MGDDLTEGLFLSRKRLIERIFTLRTNLESGLSSNATVGDHAERGLRIYKMGGCWVHSLVKITKVSVRIHIKCLDLFVKELTSLLQATQFLRLPT